MKICLNMIVKDESAVIRRCLESVKGLIDHWVIVDTGSTDGTQELIQEALQNIPGELYERPWVNFCFNRNEALDRARGKADYILIIDADEQLLILDGFDKKALEKDFYLLLLKERSFTNLYRLSLIKDQPCWHWEGVLHEYLNSKQTVVGETLKTLAKDGSTKDGNRSKNPKKFLKDAEILEEALLKEPENSRYVFYLAQSYGNGGEFSLALHYYQQRISMGGNSEEIFWSYYSIGLLHQYIGSDFLKIVDSYTKAYLNNQERAEPLYQLAQYYYEQQHPLVGYFLAKMACSLTVPKFGNYFHFWIYEYASLLTFANCAYAVGKKEEAIESYRELLKRDLPAETKVFVEKRLL